MDNEIEVVRGTTFNLTVEITVEGGGAYVPRDGDFAIFGVKRINKGDALVIKKKCRVQPDGTAFFTLKPEDTICLCCEKYTYDVGLQTGDDFYPVIPESVFRITKNVTYKGCVE